MLDNVRSWLNGSRDYFTGVALLQQYGGDKDLLTVLAKGPNDFRVRRLTEEIMQAYHHLKSNQNENHVPGARRERIAAHRTVEKISPKQKNNSATKPADPSDEKTDKAIPELGLIPNPELYAACKLEADTEYKRVMNLRAVLFSLANVEDFTDPNMPDKVKAREKMSIDVVTGFQKVSQLYDRANYVKENGRLPYTGDENKEEEFVALPDHLVKQQLDNARKAFNKLKSKEQTPERIELMQKHQANIKKLEEQWRSLKPQ